MPRGGKRPGAGRPKGSNRERQERIRELIAQAAKVKDAEAWVIEILVKHARDDAATARELANRLFGRAPIAVTNDEDSGPLVVEIIRKEMNGGGEVGRHQRDRADVPPRPKNPARHRAR